MAKKRSLNELRQEKNYGYKQPNPKVKEYSVPEPKDDIEVAKELIVNRITKYLGDTIFEMVCSEMSDHYLFQSENYLTEAGYDEFEEAWFEFYHEHHGDILGAIMKNFTN